MIFDFSYWHYFTRQGELIHNLQNAEMRKFNSRLFWILAAGVLLFALRDIWGMYTSTLTPLLAEGRWETYAIARWTSLLGALLWAGIYLAFHTYGVALLLHKLAKLPWRAALVLQTYVVSLLIIEKALVFFVFAFTGYTMSVSFFSFGPLAATFLDTPFLVLFFNQLTVFTALIIGLQYRFVRNMTDRSPKLLLMVLVLFHVAAALIVASVGFIPIEDWLSRFTEGGMPIE